MCWHGLLPINGSQASLDLWTAQLKALQIVKGLDLPLGGEDVAWRDGEDAQDFDALELFRLGFGVLF